MTFAECLWPVFAGQTAFRRRIKPASLPQQHPREVSEVFDTGRMSIAIQWKYMIYERLLLLRCELLLLNSSLAPSLRAMGTMPSSRDSGVNSFSTGDRSTGSEVHVVAHNSFEDG